jgi:hypothetical protein
MVILVPALPATIAIDRQLTAISQPFGHAYRYPGPEGGSVNEREHDNAKIGLDRSDEEQSFVDRSTIDFDPDDGLYSGTAVDGSSEIPGPHQDNESGELVGTDEGAQPEPS